MKGVNRTLRAIDWRRAYAYISEFSKVPIGACVGEASTCWLVDCASVHS